MIQIKPTNYGRGRVATQIEISIMTFSTSATNCSTYWRVSDENNQLLEEGNTKIPEAVYNDWAEDNSVIENYVLSELQLEKE